MIDKKQRGSAHIILILVAAVILSITAISTARLSNIFTNSFSTNSLYTAAEQAALSNADILKATNYDDLTGHGRQDIPNTVLSAEINISAEESLANDVKRKIASINVYSNKDGRLLYSLAVPLYKLPPDSLIPVGTIIAWSSTRNPEDVSWLECNGQSCAAYPKLVAVLGKSTVPDYRAAFLRGYGSRSSSHYGTVTHQSGALGELQGDAIRNITGSMATSMSYADGKLFQMSYVIRTFDRDGGGPVNACTFNASRVVPTANENRPVNIAVRYFIKAS